jgi:RNase H-like domain found in reverse transcriptase
LTSLLKKGTKFIWTQECHEAVNRLIKSVTTDPVLQQPDHTKPYTLEVDASQYASGAILYQPDAQGQLRPVGYYSKTFNQAERNYNIHDRELLAMMKGLEYWRHLILSSPHQLTVISNHTNLQYYQEAHTITRRVTRYIPCMADFNMRIVHCPGKTNKADPLSWPPGADQGEHNHNNVLVLPPELFVCLLTEHQSLENKVLEEQKKQATQMEQRKDMQKI